MKIGIAGLGLIGGSMAKAYRAYSDENHAEIKIFGFDINENILGFATVEGVLDGKLNENNIPECDLIFVALYPEATVDYIQRIAPMINKDAYVFDLCGTKTRVCDACFKIAEEYGFTFVGAHPMAGKQYSGYKHARSNLFHGAPMVIVPPCFDDIILLSKIKELLAPANFGKFSFTDAQSHDKMIAFTSQLAHVVSNAYIKSPTAASHKGFSAGSYKDMTRVAWLNEDMWTELFFENKEPLLYELNTVIASLCEYRDALENDERTHLKELLRDGRIAKERTDG